uniref:U8-lycotoxin-Ls1s n=1 Tax=Lycosa singoriensis TaxID=434756 RepID=TX808_LYCSI|nr:RecName: Full=U8-lycotoxin-Ls1s; AltName: Full=Toxin-like structure LSTX-H8; Flags: Precursor [Lycosa singoriensis]ACI41395.1 toxin-like structure LSTX-H8 precursor [Lycosa singoriensis]CAS03664.1 toxin-like structure LSTX-H8 precursor [Lycosa singoriensis]
MKLIIFTGLVLFAIVSLIEAQAENERACLPQYQVCTDAPGNCCSNLVCDCYGRYKSGTRIGRNCFCLQKGVIYKREN